MHFRWYIVLFYAYYILHMFILLAEASCVTEMALVMACWKQNDFNTKLCSNELTVFYRCIEKAQVNLYSQEIPSKKNPAGWFRSAVF